MRAPRSVTWGLSVPPSLQGLPWDSWHRVTHGVALLGSQGQLGRGCGQMPRAGAGEKAVGPGPPSSLLDLQALTESLADSW